MTNNLTAHSPNIAIIGGGLAGLTTGWRLQEKNLNIHIYEARPRAGGRIFTVYLNDTPCELGGHNIADGGEATYTKQLAHKLGLTLYETHLPPIVHNYFDGNTLILEKDLMCHIPHLSAQLIDAARTGKNMRDVLQSLVTPNTPLYHVLATRLAAYEGAPIEQLSTLYISTLYAILLGGLSAPAPEGVRNFVTIEGGNSKLTDTLARTLPITYNMPLTSIEKTQGGKYLLTFQDHTNALYDIVILAIPCSLYKTIHCKDNVIPKERKHLLDSMQCGYTTKILAPLKDGSHHLKTAIDHNTIAWAQDNILTLYYIEKPDLLPVEPFFASKSKMLKTAFEFTPPHAITHVKDETFCTYNSSITHNWPHDPYAQGSYSYIAPGQEELEYAFVEEEEEKVKAPFASINRSLYFVGEHTSLGPRGTIEAACESGERIARIITKRHYE